MAEWTPEMVEERLIEAAAVLKRLPPVRVGGYFNVWPKMMVEFSDLVGQTPEPMLTAAAVRGRDQQDGAGAGVVRVA